MPACTARANAAKSTVRARVEHVFARQKDQMGLFVRTIGLARAEAKITLANLAYNIDRLIFHERRAAMGKSRPAKAPRGRKDSRIRRLQTEAKRKTRVVTPQPALATR